jgi:hypothetical protein
MDWRDLREALALLVTGVVILFCWTIIVTWLVAR